ncbi:UbiH/UbiF family hydroxylase [Rhodobacteraceae bacterium 63075]|nr:UbiH/UbiF family hydroxylase [Rhodobacteraceae bacterium 63075]
MQTQHTEVFVSGGGIAGMITALAFAEAGFSVVCVDPATPVTDRAAKGADMRSTAFLQPSRALLEEIGLWARLEAHAAPLQVMRIIDAGGETPTPRVESEFDATDISEQPFGWNFPNWLLRREALAALEAHPQITPRFGVGVQDVLTRSEAVRLRLSDGSTVSTKLLIAADGRNSPVRRALRIDVQTIRYGQKALAFTVSHPIPHNNISTEIHRSGGPFTLVPLPDRDGLPASAIVWMERGEEALRLRDLDKAAFEKELNARSCGILGPLELTSPRDIWPIISQYARSLTGERTALIAEAAHVIPPIGAQGLNMSLADLRALRDQAVAHRGALGSREMLDAYARGRLADIRLRITGIDALNRASMAGARPLRDLRALGLNAIHGVKPLRKSLMQIGLGAKG